MAQQDYKITIRDPGGLVADVVLREGLPSYTRPYSASGLSATLPITYSRNDTVLISGRATEDFRRDWIFTQVSVTATDLLNLEQMFVVRQPVLQPASFIQIIDEYKAPLFQGLTETANVHIQVNPDTWLANTFSLYQPSLYWDQKSIAIDSNSLAGSSTMVVDDGAGAAPVILPVGARIEVNSENYTVTSVTVGSPTANEHTYGITPNLISAVTDGDVITVLSDLIKTQIGFTATKIT